MRERAALIINKAIQCPSFDYIDEIDKVKRRPDSFLGLVLGIVLSRITLKPLRIPTENIHNKRSLDSKLFFLSICSIRILTRTEVMTVLNKSEKFVEGVEGG